MTNFPCDWSNNLTDWMKWGLNLRRTLQKVTATESLTYNRLSVNRRGFERSLRSYRVYEDTRLIVLTYYVRYYNIARDLRSLNSESIIARVLTQWHFCRRNELAMADPTIKVNWIFFMSACASHRQIDLEMARDSRCIPRRICLFRRISTVWHRRQAVIKSKTFTIIASVLLHPLFSITTNITKNDKHNKHLEYNRRVCGKKSVGKGPNKNTEFSVHDTGVSIILLSFSFQLV